MPFSTRIKIRFGDADPAGLVYYPNIFHYFHIASPVPLPEKFREAFGDDAAITVFNSKLVICAPASTRPVHSLEFKSEI